MTRPQPAPKFPSSPQRLADAAGHLTRPLEDPYLHWDELRRRPLPNGLPDHETWWFALRLRRQLASRALPLRDVRGAPFSYTLPDVVLQLLHRVDAACTGQLASPVRALDAADQRRFLLRSLREEAMSSSMLEGAATTRAVAKELLISGRAPRTTDERMIRNNYEALQLVRTWVGEPLTADRVLQLHACVTDGTLAHADAAGRFRTASERVKVVDAFDGDVLHDPPPAEELADRLTALCAFANNRVAPWTHPVVRAITLHFAIGYDHPFVDGNGRTARALFYWSLLDQGYWLAEHLPISRILRSGPRQYARAYEHVESDAGDVTYFLLHQLRVLDRALSDLDAYVSRKRQELASLERVLRTDVSLHGRQLALLKHALAHPDTEYTIESHQQHHVVAYGTARSDLYELERRGFLHRFKRGKRFVFVASDDLAERLKR